MTYPIHEPFTVANHFQDLPNPTTAAELGVFIGAEQHCIICAPDSMGPYLNCVHLHFPQPLSQSSLSGFPPSMAIPPSNNTHFI
jgi:hypothetical protein